MNYAAVRLPATVQTQTSEAAASLERKRDERMSELHLAGWRPSAGWLMERRPFVALQVKRV